MRIYEGSPRQDWEEVLRSIGAYLDDKGMRAVIFIETDAGFIVQATSGVLAILTLIFQPDGLGTVTAPIGRWLKGEPFVFGSRGGAGAEGLSVRP